MRMMFWIGARPTGDSRVTLFRFESGQWERREGWKISISLHPRLFYWQRQYKQLRATLFGLNIHWRKGGVKRWAM